VGSRVTEAKIESGETKRKKKKRKKSRRDQVIMIEYRFE